MIGDWGETLAALCVWREARGESFPAKLGVAWVLKNRQKYSGKSLDQIVLAPKQFASFLRSDPNSSKFPLADDQSWQDSCAAIDEVMFGETPDPTNGARWFVSGKDLPEWTKLLRPTVTIGGFIFFAAK